MDKLGFDESSKRSFLTNRHQSVILQDYLSDQKTLFRGVPTGTVPDPFLFILYINDVATRVDKETELIQNADDTVILTFRTFTNESKAKKEQNSSQLNQYFHEHQLRVNTSKTEFMIFG